MDGWIAGAHEAWARDGQAPDSSPLVRFAVTTGQGLAVGVVRQSSDGLRRHPVALFVEDTRDVAPGRWHLLPLACTGTWEALAEILARSVTSVGELLAALDDGAPAPDPSGAESSYAKLLARSDSEGAWPAFTAARGDTARHLALNLITAARAQREARSAAEGVGIALPLPADAEAASGHAALWLELLSAAGVPPARPAILVGADPPRLVALYRPPEGRDLAAVLSSLGMAPIDDLSEPWQRWPPADPDLAAGIETLVTQGSTALATLPSRVRAVAGT
jgi:hypothetical protein